MSGSRQKRTSIEWLDAEWDHLGSSAQTVKDELKLLVARRNQIAHEADVDPSYPGQRWPITAQDAEDAIALVRRLGASILAVVG